MKNLKRTFLIVLVLAITGKNFVAARVKTLDSPGERLIIDIDYRGKDKEASDTLTLKFCELYTGPYALGDQKVVVLKRNSKGMFHADLAVTKLHGYFELSASSSTLAAGSITKVIFSPQFWEAGDSILITVSPKETVNGAFKAARFSGRGSAKYTARYILQNLPYLDFFPDQSTNPTFENYSKKITKDESRKLEILSDFQANMSTLSYNILKADICYYSRSIYYGLKTRFQSLDQPNVSTVNDFRLSAANAIMSTTDLDISKEGLINSAEYLRFKYDQIKARAYLENLNDDLDYFFNKIIKSTEGNTREALMISYFNIERNTDSAAKYFKAATEIIKAPTFKEMLSQIKMIVPGWTLSDYTLTNERGEEVSLSQYDDKVILLDLWGVGCGGCVRFYKDVLSKIEEKYAGNGKIVFLSIGTDTSLRRWKDGITTGNYTGSRSINLFTNGEGWDHPILNDHKIISIPTVILLNKGRKVISFNSEGLYKYDSLLNAISSLL